MFTRLVTESRFQTLPAGFARGANKVNWIEPVLNVPRIVYDYKSTARISYCHRSSPAHWRVQRHTETTHCQSEPFARWRFGRGQQSTTLTAIRHLTTAATHKTYLPGGSMTDLDQAEIEARLEVLSLKARYLSAELEAVTGSRVSTPTVTRADIIADLETMEAHCASLERKLGEARTATGTASATTITIPATAKKSEPFLQKALRENGCATVAELNAKTEVNRLEKLVSHLSGLSRQVVQKKLDTAKARLTAVRNQTTKR
jgi:hypothetical protein